MNGEVCSSVETLRRVNSVINAVAASTKDGTPKNYREERKATAQLLQHCLGRKPTSVEIEKARAEVWGI